MSEVKLRKGWKIIQEFPYGPSLLAVSYAYFAGLNGDKDADSIYCRDISNNRIFFKVTSPTRREYEKNSKGDDVRAIEVDVIRDHDNKEGVLVFIEGHRHATFFDTSGSTKDQQQDFVQEEPSGELCPA